MIYWHYDIGESQIKSSQRAHLCQFVFSSTLHVESPSILHDYERRATWKGWNQFNVDKLTLIQKWWNIDEFSKFWCDLDIEQM